jgi:O-antigen ligase
MNADLRLYRGLSYNPNYLGMLLMMALPVLLLYSVRNDVTKLRKRLAVGVLLLVVIMLLQTVSRASLLSASVVLLFFLWGRGAVRLAVILAIGILVAGMTSIFAPKISDDLALKFIKKGQSEESFLYSRETVFGESFEAARAGGIFGLGHGVSFGFSDYSFGQGSAQYGREKGNGTLAMVEELGWAGLLLFVLMLLSLIRSLVTAVRMVVSREERTVLFVLLGTILALLIHTQFEAWLLSPGAAATPIFWALVGVASELSVRIRKKAIDRRMYSHQFAYSNSRSGRHPALGA